MFSVKTFIYADHIAENEVYWERENNNTKSHLFFKNVFTVFYHLVIPSLNHSILFTFI